MLNAGRYLYVGFMAHQAVEKILKALFVSRFDEQPPYTHSLSILVKKIGLEKDLSEMQFGIIDILEPLNIEARYPTHKEKLLNSLSAEKCADILVQTQELYQWILQKL